MHVAYLLTHYKLALTEFEMTDADTPGAFPSKVESPTDALEILRKWKRMLSNFHAEQSRLELF